MPTMQAKQQSERVPIRATNHAKDVSLTVRTGRICNFTFGHVKSLPKLKNEARGAKYDTFAGPDCIRNKLPK